MAAIALVLVVAAVVVAAAILARGHETAEASPFVPSGSPAGSPFGAAASGGQPVFGRVYVIVLENHSLDSAVNGGQMPYLKKLIAGGALATKYAAVGHPSQPNYIALFSGDTHGIDDDRNHDLDAPNLADQLEAHGRTWSVSAENYPGGCSRAAVASGGADGKGTYARKHNPAISFKSIAGNAQRCARIHNLASFNPSEADFQLIVPNMCNDAHDCPLSTADGFLSTFVPKITDSAAFKQNGVLFITFDEAEGGRPNTVPLVAIGPSVQAGSTSDASFSHYSLLRTIEDNWSLGCLGRACAATPLTPLFKPATP